MTEKRQSIVLVDDEGTVLSSFQRLLGQWYEVHAFSSADDLLAAVDNLRPSLFLLDWLMPGLDGIALARRLRRETRFDLAPIAFLTALDPTPKNVEEAYRSGAQSFISKSYSPSFILVQVRALVDNSERLRHLFRQREILLALVKHDVSNLLTGVITGLEVLAMHPAFRKRDLGAQAETILKASSKLRDLFFDLTDILSGGDEKAGTGGRERVDEILADFTAYTGLIGRRIICESAPDLAVAGDRRRLGRSLFYLVKFLDLHLPRDLPVTVRARAEGSAVVFSVGVPGPQGAALGRLLAEGEEPATASARYDLLFLQYVRNALDRHRVKLSLVEEEDETALRFALPAATYPSEESPGSS